MFRTISRSALVPKAKLRIDGQLVSGQREPAAGDVLEIGKVKAAFSFQD